MFEHSAVTAGYRFLLYCCRGDVVAVIVHPGYGKRIADDLESVWAAHAAGVKFYWRSRVRRWLHVRILLEPGETPRPALWPEQLRIGLRRLGLIDRWEQGAR